MEGAHGVLLSISGGSDLGLFEINEAASLVSDAAHADANIIFGAVIDDALGDEVRVTVIAAGFDGGKPQGRKDAGIASVPVAAPVAPPAAPRMPLHPQPVAGVPSATAGERLMGAAQPQQAQPNPPSQVPGRPTAGGGITVPPLPPVPGSNGAAAGRRPLSNEDFEEELDIPEFLRQ
jgi:cell division protein FtsZ